MARERDPLRRFCGALLMAVGGLLAVFSGGCALLFGGSVLLEDDIGSLLSLMPVLGFFGVLPALVGVGVFRWGSKLFNR